MRIVAIVLWVPLVFFAANLVMDIYWFQKAKPPSEVMDVGTFLKWKPKIVKVVEIERGTNVYYQILGPSGRMWASGPSGYVFNSDGKFIGWSKDIGDFKKPEVIYSGVTGRRTIKLEELTNTLGNQALSKQ